MKVVHARRQWEQSAEVEARLRGREQVQLHVVRTWERSSGRPFVVRTLTVEVAGVSLMRARYRECLMLLLTIGDGGRGRGLRMAFSGRRVAGGLK